MTAAEAVAAIAPGDHVVIGGGAGLPSAFCEALADAANGLDDVTVHQTMALGAQPHLVSGVTTSTFFAQSGPVADAVAEGRIRFVPAHFSQMSATIPRVDHLVVQVAPPVAEGYPYGVFVGYLHALREHAGRIVCEVNPAAPMIGGARIGLGQADAVYEADRPLPELVVGTAIEGTPEARIADLVADRVPDGATLQLGFGRITDCIVGRLQDRRHLGLHTETFTDAVLPLITTGALDNSRKTHERGRSVCTLVMGTRRLYNFLDGGDDVAMLPVETTNDPAVIGRNDHVVAINSALEIDLWGQANVETIGGRQVGGIGGQVDFARGAAASRGGRFILAATSTARDGAVSRIVPTLSGPVSTSRVDTDVVITEHGVAELRGRDVRTRARALIAIADPRHRDDLQQAARAAGLC